jgi:hypothetical protein
MLIDGPLDDSQTDIIFANDLSFGTDPLAEVMWGNLTVDSAPTGFVCPSESLGASCPAAVPEPTSLTLLGAALGLFLVSSVSSRGIRRAGKPYLDKTDGA